MNKVKTCLVILGICCLVVCAAEDNVVSVKNNHHHVKLNQDIEKVLLQCYANIPLNKSRISHVSRIIRKGKLNKKNSFNLCYILLLDYHARKNRMIFSSKQEISKLKSSLVNTESLLLKSLKIWQSLDAENAMVYYFAAYVDLQNHRNKSFEKKIEAGNAKTFCTEYLPIYDEKKQASEVSYSVFHNIFYATVMELKIKKQASVLVRFIDKMINTYPENTMRYMKGMAYLFVVKSEDSLWKHLNMSEKSYVIKVIGGYRKFCSELLKCQTEKAKAQLAHNELLRIRELQEKFLTK